MARKRNYDMHTSANDAKRNILLGLLSAKGQLPPPNG